MQAAGLSLEDLQTLIEDISLDVGLGRLEQGNDALIVRTRGRPRNLEDLSDLVVASGPKGTYRLADVADLSIGHLTRYGAVTRNGEETTQALVIALKDSNTDQVVTGVKSALAALQPTLPPGTELNIFYDRAQLIDTAIGTISGALLQAVVLVILLLALFLGHLRAALVVSLSLPLAALATFLLMSLTGLSANLMSLGGLVIAIGMIVDSSVVVVENVLTRLARNPGLPRLHVILRAVSEVAVPVVSGTVIVIIVFSPLLTLTGLEGKLFTPVALTIVFAMVSALVLALTVVPLLASVLLGEKNVGMPGYMERLAGLYRASLERVLNRPLPLAATVAVVLLISIVLFFNTGRTFMPVLDEGDIIVQLEKSPSISLTASVDLDRQVEQALLARVPEIRQIVARTGSDELGLDPMGLNETDIFMELAPIEEWRMNDKQAIIAAIREVMLEFPGISFGFTQPIQMRVSEMLTGSSGDLSVKVFGDDLAVLARLATDTARIARGIEGAVDVQATVTDGGQFLVIEPDQAIARAQGLSAVELAARLKSQLEGVVFSEVIEGRERTPLVFANSPESAPATVRDLERHQVVLPTGGTAPLQEIATVRFQEGPLLIEREQGRRFAVVTTNIEGRDTLGFVDDLRQALDQGLDRPSGYSIEFGGEFENQQRATRSLMLVVPGALLLILIILFATFQSLPLAGLILANIPFALMGGIIALFISGEYLSVPASIGLIALLGVAVLNGVVMVSYFEQQRGRRTLDARIV
ncbi:MAG: efflux RND transporter permease subunit, partial [Wenzhouxiangella sp.]|nr:efflux RND transporter permease subunit [Wenzhouxiangella sp.]